MPDCSVDHLPRVALIALDLDGTLVDSVPDLCTAANHTLAVMGLPPQSEQAVRTMVGDGIDALLARCLHSALGRQPSQAELATARPLMRDYYGQHSFVRSTVYPGVMCALKRWQAQGIALYCVTNKASALAAPLLERAGLAPWFEALYCADEPGERKPRPTLLLRLLERCQQPAARCLMIGDSSHDMLAAHGAGMRAVAVDYGYGFAAIRAHPEAPPWRVVQRLDQLALSAGSPAPAEVRHA